MVIQVSSFFDDVSVTEEAINTAQFGIIYGPPDCGKSQILRYSDTPFYVATEKGCEKVKNVGKFLIDEGKPTQRVKLPANSDEFFEIMKMIKSRKGVIKGKQYKTIVIDSAKFLEILFCDDYLAKNPTYTENKQTKKATNIGDYKFGRGAQGILRYWEKFFVVVKSILDLGVDVTLICHSLPSNESTLNGDDYKKHKIDLMAFGKISCPALVAAAADWQYFMRKESQTRKIKNAFGSDKTIAMDGSTPEIILYTRGTAAFDAKAKTINHKDIPDYYEIDINNPETSKIVFSDLKK